MDQKLVNLYNAIDETQRIQKKFFRENLDLLVLFCQGIAARIQEGGKLIIMGNGGSAADAQHIAAEFINRFQRDRKPMPAIALTTDTSIITSIGNDYGFDYIFSKQIQAIAQPFDIVLGITTSGNSPNIVEGFKVARQKRIETSLITGQGGGEAAEYADTILRIPTNSTARIQEVMLIVEHLICGWVEDLMYPVPEE